MLPDLRIVVAAVISTFVLTVGVGFYASSRLISEPKRSTDSLTAFEETPVNRIALSWPAPARQSEPLALDFAVTAKALRNPVRDVTAEPAPADQPSPLVRTATTDLAPPEAEKPAQIERTHIEASPAPALTEAPKPAPEPEIHVAVQYPPVLALPPELQTPAEPDVTAAPTATETAETTASITESPKSPEKADDDAAPVAAQPSDTQIASRPEPADASEDNPEIEPVPAPKPAPKTKARKAAPKKAASAKTAKRPRAVRRIGQPILPNVSSTFPWNFFGTTLPN
jgi:hypothetical protein